MSRPGCLIYNSVIESFFSRMRAETERTESVNSMKEKEIQIFNWIDFNDTDRISLPRKIREDRIFDYEKAIEKAKKFKNLKLTK